MKAALRKIHRYISLSLAGVWLVQALTGALMVFHWEIDDALVPGAERPVDLQAVAAAARQLQFERADAKVVSLYPTAGQADRFDIYVEDAGGRTDVVRVDGAGQPLVARPSDYDYPRAGLIQAAIVLHQTLFAGDRGKLFLGCSGVFLLSNLILGIKLAWPRRGDWRRALMPAPVRAHAAQVFSWHRATGLWFALPAFVLITGGMLLAFEDPLENFLGTGVPPAALEGATSTRVKSLATALVDPGEALKVAFGRFPASSLAGLRMPSDNAPWYRVRVLQPGEPARVYGSTAVYVSAEDGRVLAVDDALQASARQRFVDLLFPLHTGEVAGLPGRLLALATSLWLLTMLTLGIILWSARRRPTSTSSSTV
jgi:uncharacterized iron-regulated membrane protein